MSNCFLFAFFVNKNNARTSNLFVSKIKKCYGNLDLIPSIFHTPVKKLKVRGGYLINASNP